MDLGGGLWVCGSVVGAAWSGGMDLSGGRGKNNLARVGGGRLKIA